MNKMDQKRKEKRESANQAEVTRSYPGKLTKRMVKTTMMTMPPTIMSNQLSLTAPTTNPGNQNPEDLHEEIENHRADLETQAVDHGAAESHRSPTRRAAHEWSLSRKTMDGAPS